MTFDDGYVDNLTVASPILTEFGIPATFFVTTARLTETHEFWWDTLTAVMQDESALPRALDLPLGTGCRLSLDSSDERRGALRTLHGIIRSLPFVKREAVLQTVLAQYPPRSEFPEHARCSKRSYRNWPAASVTTSAHTRSIISRCQLTLRT